MKEKTMKVNTKISVLLCLAAVGLPSAASAQFGHRFRGAEVGRAGGGHITWSGTVDNTTIVTLNRGDVNTQVVSGKSSGDVNAQVVGRLPARPVRVFLRQSQGRGYIQIIQEPNPGNGFTAQVRIHDPQAGSSFYRFVLAWGRGSRFGGGPGAF